MKTRSKKLAKRTSAAHHNGRSTTKTLARQAGEAVGGVWKSISDAAQMLTGEIHVEFQTLHDFFVAELEDLYSAEHQLLDALPKMAEAATSKSLKKAFQTHRRETVGQVTRLRQVFRSLGLKPSSKTCKAMKGLIAEGDQWISEDAEPGVKDVGLIAAAQRVEHYEIAGYGCVRTYARLLGHAKAAKLLQATLDEEGTTDKKLTELSVRLNVRAAPGHSKNGRALNGHTANGHAANGAKPTKRRRRRAG